MEWKNSFSTGIKKVDDEHKILVNMIDRLEQAMNKGESEEVMGYVLKNLVDYAKFHFKSEEKIMANIGFPGLNRHRVLHKDLVNEIAGILIDLKKDRMWTIPELVGFLHHWLVDHIIGEDREIGRYLGVI